MVNKFFQLEEKQTNIKIELVAGLTTFLTMAYIIVVNPAILSEAGMDKKALIAVTCIVTAIATIIVGVFAKAPIAMAWDSMPFLHTLLCWAAKLAGKRHWGLCSFQGCFSSC